MEITAAAVAVIVTITVVVVVVVDIGAALTLSKTKRKSHSFHLWHSFFYSAHCCVSLVKIFWLECLCTWHLNLYVVLSPFNLISSNKYRYIVDDVGTIGPQPQRVRVQFFPLCTRIHSHALIARQLCRKLRQNTHRATTQSECQCVCVCSEIKQKNMYLSAVSAVRVCDV